MLFKMSEWETNGKFHCGCIDDLGHNSGVWYLPCRFLDLSPAQYLELVLTKYKPDDVYCDKEKCLCFWSWTKQADMRRFKNDMNAAARKKNFQI